MKRFLFVLFILGSLAGYSQRKKEKPNYLRRAKQDPETLFTLCGKKNGKKVKAAELATAEGIKPGEKFFDGLDILGMEVIIKRKGAGEEKFSNTNLQFTAGQRTKLESLTKGDKLSVFVKVRNRSTQVVNLVKEHVFYVGG